MKKIIESITKDSKIIIDNKEYYPIAKVIYTTINCPKDMYAKVFMKDHYTLVLSPEDDLIYFGEDKGQIIGTFPTPNEFDYNNEHYKVINSDYQVVQEIVFGDPSSIEGEVRFIDYEGVYDNNNLISIGIIVKNNARADIVAKIIEDSMINVIV